MKYEIDIVVTMQVEATNGASALNKGNSVLYATLNAADPAGDGLIVENASVSFSKARA